MTAEHAAGVGGEVEALADALGDIRVANARKAEWWTSDTEHSLLIKVLRGECVPWADGLLTSDWLATRDATTRATAADTVLAAARRLCCGDNPAPHHAATDAHSTRMAFAEELARAVRGS